MDADAGALYLTEALRVLRQCKALADRAMG